MDSGTFLLMAFLSVAIVGLIGELIEGRPGSALAGLLLIGAFFGVAFGFICLLGWVADGLSRGEINGGTVVRWFFVAICVCIGVYAVVRIGLSACCRVYKWYADAPVRALVWYDKAKGEKNLPVAQIRSCVDAGELQLLYLSDLFHVKEMVLQIRNSADLQVDELEQIYNQLQEIKALLQKFDEGAQRMFHPCTHFFKELEFDLVAACQTPFSWDNRPLYRSVHTDNYSDYSLLMWYNAIVELFNLTFKEVTTRIIQAKQDMSLPEEARNKLESDIAWLRDFAKRAKDNNFSKYKRIKDRNRTPVG